jgi:hypothetical protein
MRYHEIGLRFTTKGIKMTVTMSKKKKHVGRKRDRGELYPFMFEMTPELNAALEACAERDRRTKRAVVLIALEAYLQREGLWPVSGKAVADGK